METAARDIRSTTSCKPDVLKVWQLDMRSYASVVFFAERAITELPRLDALLANAGIHTEKWCVTEGNEEHITTNVISTALISCLLHPKLQATASKHQIDTHISIAASDLYFVADFKERLAPDGQLFASLNDEKKSNIIDRYNVSKLLEIYIIRDIAATAPYDSHRVIVNCVPPGFCHSELIRDRENLGIKVVKKVLARPTEVGSRTLIHAASAAPASHGQYLEDGVKIRRTLGYTQGKEGADIQHRFWVELEQVLETIRSGITSFK